MQKKISSHQSSKNIWTNLTTSHTTKHSLRSELDLVVSNYNLNSSPSTLSYTNIPIIDINYHNSHLISLVLCMICCEFRKLIWSKYYCPVTINQICKQPNII